MNKAIERIKGFCCEVNEQQWEELVRVAHENGVNPSPDDDWDEHFPVFFIDFYINEVDAHAGVKSAKKDRRKLTAIPYPDFLAKLKGEEEEWRPKNMELVLGSFDDGDTFIDAIFIGMHGTCFVCFTPFSDQMYSAFDVVKKNDKAITRAEAEQQLGKRIID